MTLAWEWPSPWSGSGQPWPCRRDLTHFMHILMSLMTTWHHDNWCSDVSFRFRVWSQQILPCLTIGPARVFTMITVVLNGHLIERIRLVDMIGRLRWIALSKSPDICCRFELSYNPQSQKAEIERSRTELGDDLDAAQEEILQIVLDNKRKFDQTVRTRKSCGIDHAYNFHKVNIKADIIFKIMRILLFFLLLMTYTSLIEFQERMQDFLKNPWIDKQLVPWGTL